MFTLRINTSPTVLQDTGMTQSQLDQVLNNIQLAAEIWGRYIDAPTAIIDLTLSFSDLPGSTLGQAGTSFSGFTGGVWQASTINEFNTPDGGNGDEEAFMTIDLPSIFDNSFHYSTDTTYVANPGAPGQVDFLTLIVHELGHSLGFLNASSFTTTYGNLVSGGTFNGANAVAANGGTGVQLSGDQTHFQGNDLMSPSIQNNLREVVTAVHVGVLQDIGAPVAMASAGADTLFGFEITGDTINGLGGADTLSGLSGADHLKGGTGNDTLDGGADIDRAVYDGNGRSGAGITFSAALTAGGALQVTDNVGGQGTDTLIGIERLEFDDFIFSLFSGTNAGGTIIGDSLPSVIVGGSGADYLLDTAGGDDVLFGGEGNDQLQGSGGADQNFGGGGTDQVRYANSASGVTVNLATGAASGGDAAGDTFDSIENIAGSQHGDMLTGDAGVNDIQGLGGNDTINGGAGADTLNGGGGIDTLDYADSASSGPTGRSFGVTDVNGVYVTLGGGVQEGGDAQGDVALLFENVTGTQFNDWLTGTNEVNTLTGGDGHDWLLDLGGNDTLIGGIGNDWLQGGEGGDVNNGGGDTDRVRYTQSDDVVNVNLTTGMGTGGHAQGDTYIEVEDITGSYGFGDILTGNGVNNLIEGLTGNDHLDGGMGLDVDLLAGGIGFDIFHFSSGVWGSDYLIDFEDGIDRIDLAGSGLTLGDFTQVDTAYGLRLDYNDGINGLQNIVIAGLDAGDITSADFV